MKPHASRPVVWISFKDAACAACGAALERGQFIVMDREHGIRCASCAGLGGLVFLPSGDVALTRRALEHSSCSAIVVKFSRARGRNERQGVLVEEAALARAQSDNLQDEARREVQRRRRQARDAVAEQEYVRSFAARVLELFPGVPDAEAQAIALRACQKHSGRVGRSAAAKALAPEAVALAVRAHVRHAHTEYDRLIGEGGLEPGEARALVRPVIQAWMARWRGAKGGS